MKPANIMEPAKVVITDHRIARIREVASAGGHALPGVEGINVTPQLAAEDLERARPLFGGARHLLRAAGLASPEQHLDAWRLASTVARLAGGEGISGDHMAEALELRHGLHKTPAGVLVPIIDRAALYRYSDVIQAEYKGGLRGLGIWSVIIKSYGIVWVYRAPGHPWVPAEGVRFGGEPPPLPKPPEKWEQCRCHRRPHTCTGCGTPHWIEIHGMADGFCTYCYRRG